MNRIANILKNARTESTGFRKKHTPITKQLALSLAIGLSVSYVGGKLDNKSPHTSNLTVPFTNIFFYDLILNGSGNHKGSNYDSVDFREQLGDKLPEVKQKIQEWEQVKVKINSTTASLNNRESSVDYQGKKFRGIEEKDYLQYTLLIDKGIQLINEIEPDLDAASSVIYKRETASLQHLKELASKGYDITLERTDVARSHGESESTPSHYK